MLFAPKMAQAVSGAAVPIDFTTADFSSASGEKRAASRRGGPRGDQGDWRQASEVEQRERTGGKRAK
jgi:hypothetical protein